MTMATTPAMDNGRQGELACAINQQEVNKPKPFNSKIGNRGEVNINKAPELITVSDVRKALTIPALDTHATLFTAEQAGLQPGTTAAVGLANAAALRNLPANCPGLKLDKMYYVRLQSGYTNPIHPSTYIGDNGNRSIVLDHDFVIDGEVDGKAVGGFHIDQTLFYTEHSLNLRKVHLEVENGGTFYPFFINCMNGIDQIQVKDCVFDGKPGKQSRMFYFYFKNISPTDDDGVPISTNYINHILFDGNTAHGHHFVHSPGMRVVKSCRIINNTFTDITGDCISLFTDNSRKYAVRMTYMSCPIFIVGNTFAGVDKVMKKRVSWSVYYCAALIESSTLYMLHNTIRNFISGKSLYITAKGDTINGSIATYDLYANVTQLYYCNNHVTNLLKFTKNRSLFGIVKAKDSDVPLKYQDAHPPIIRYVRQNTYDIDEKAAQEIWENRTYPTKGGDYSMEIDYDNELVFEDFLTINFIDYVGKFPMHTFDFSNNTLKARNIGGMESPANLTCSHFICDNNKFYSTNISSSEYYTRSYYVPQNKEWLFTVRGIADSNGDTSVHITGNTGSSNNKSVKLMLYKYNKGEPSTAKRSTINDNHFKGGYVIRGLNSTEWRASKYPY